jgi:hypothetical protein
MMIGTWSAVIAIISSIQIARIGRRAATATG